MRTEVRIGGFGGQGVILTGYVIAKAASLYDGQHATMTQSFGPEARGSACSAEVVISTERIMNPYVRNANVLVALSQEAYNKFAPKLVRDGIMITDEDLVEASDLPDSVKLFSIPATRFAEELGRRLVMNMVVAGFFTAVTGLVSADAMRRAVETSVPRGTEKLNLQAFERGYQFGLARVTG